jgi:hypothetical protein
LTPNPILKVLSTLSSLNVRYLLMGGQACVLYGGAEFSRDTDIVVLADANNLAQLQTALSELKAECIAVPQLTADYLLRGHAVHFRCWHPEALRMRVDVMSVLRGVEPFEALWARRTTIEYAGNHVIELVSLPDLVAAKKTQRDKDWPMIRRLIEADYLARRDSPSDADIKFWLSQSRTPSMLVELKSRFPNEFDRHVSGRPLLSLVKPDNESQIEDELAAEERRERDLDRAYWQPLRAELQELLRTRPRN